MKQRRKFSSQAGLASIRAGLGYTNISKDKDGGTPFNAVLGDKNRLGGPFNPIIRERKFKDRDNNLK